MENVFLLGNLKGKFEVFGWDVMEIKEGNNFEVIFNGMKIVKFKIGKGKFVCVLLYIVMGNGVDFMMYIYDWYGKVFNDE